MSPRMSVGVPVIVVVKMTDEGVVDNRPVSNEAESVSGGRELVILDSPVLGAVPDPGLLARSVQVWSAPSWHRGLIDLGWLTESPHRCDRCVSNASPHHPVRHSTSHSNILASEPKSLPGRILLLHPSRFSERERDPSAVPWDVRQCWLQDS